LRVVSGFPDWATNSPGPGFGARRGLLATNLDGVTVSVSLDSITLSEASANGQTMGFPSMNTTASVNGAVGPQGLDVAGIKTASTNLYLYVIGKSTDGSMSLIFSKSRYWPLMPAGWDMQARVAATRQDSSNSMIRFSKRGPKVYYGSVSTTSLVAAGTSVTIADVDASAYVPPTATEILVTMTIYGPTTFFSGTLYDYDRGQTAARMEINGSTSTSADMGTMQTVPLSQTGNCKFQYSVGNVTGRKIDLGCWGYTDSDGQ